MLIPLVLLVLNQGTMFAIASSLIASNMLAFTPSTALASHSPASNIEIADSVATRKAAEKAVQEFLAQWRLSWQRTNERWYKATRSEPATALRATYLHCHPHTNEPKFGLEPERRDGYVPAWANVLALSKCPSWVLGPLMNGADAALDPDSTLDAEWRKPMRDARQRLLDHLANARRQLPGDHWIVGQQVRFLVDHGQKSEAIAIARSCRVDRWWCSALTGYAFARVDRMKAADSAFRVAGAALSDSVRCTWADVGALLRPRDRRAYAKASCVQRDTLSTRHLWLSSPLFIEPVNERRIAHFMRRVLVMLHSSLPEDEYYHWRIVLGGDAVAEVIMRYGWPSVVAWRKDQDDPHTHYIAGFGAQPAAPYSSAEYSVGRVQYSPAWSAVLSPFEAEEEAWQLRPPVGRSEDQTTGDPLYRWWPIEHMAHSGRRVVELPAGQFAALRRQTNIRVAAAVESPPSVWSSLHREHIAVTLVASEAPDSVERIAEKTDEWTGRIVLDGYTRSRPFVVGVESAGNARRPMVLRTRMGITPPQSLDAIMPGTVDISAPIFFRPILIGPQPVVADSVIPHMFGTLTVPFEERLGLFWEAYGVQPGDSVSFTVTIAPATGPGLLRRVGATLRLVDEPAGGVALGWTDGRSRQTSAPDPGMVPILPRSIVVDLRTLQPGAYIVEVAVAVPGKPTARGQRRLNVQ